MKLTFLVILSFIIGSIFGIPQVNFMIKKLDKLDNDTAKVNLLNSIASEIYFTNVDEIYGYAQHALELSNDIAYEHGKAQAYNNLGIYYRAKGIFSQSIDYHFNSLKIMEDIVDSAGIARCYNLIGILYYYLKNDDLAEEYLLKALEINKLQGDTKWIAGNTNNLGMIFERRGDYYNALKYYINALETNRTLDNQRWIGNNYGNIGRLYLNLKNYPLAEEYFQKQLALKEAQHDILGISASLLYLGQYNLIQGLYEEAIKALQRSYKLADSVGSLPELRNVSNELSNAYYALGNYEEALKYDILNSMLDDSINYQVNIQKITRLQLQYDYRKNLQLEDYKYERTWFLYLIFVLSLLFIILFAILMYIRQNGITQQHIQKEKRLAIGNTAMQHELLFKEKQLEDNILFLVSKNELITNIIEKLVTLKSSLQQINKNFIDEIISDLKSGVTDHIWNEFELRFNQIHSGFYNNLNIHFPNLSANEKKLCAFLKLNMTTKEISAISKQSTKSIEGARTRLRKKLKLTETDINLTEFLSNF